MSRTLVLNASYEPLCVVTLHRAAVLVLLEKAEPVEIAEQPLRSTSTVVVAPKVIRLKKMVRVPYRSTTRVTKRTVLLRDGYQCAYCTKRRGETVDHILPTSRGGTNTWDNVVAACKVCNGRKADRTPEEAGMTLRFRPQVPRGTTALVLALGSVDPIWKPYLAYAV